jgi:hypothetical protein
MSTYTTRSGRAVRKPVLYEPEERPEDDFGADDYDEDDPNGEGDDVPEDDEDDEDDEEDADEHGNLKGFVVDDTEDDEED